MMDKNAILQTINSLKEQIGQLESAISGDGMEGEEQQMSSESMDTEMPEGGGTDDKMAMLQKPKSSAMPDMLKKYMS